MLSYQKGKRTLKTGLGVAGYVLSGKSIKESAKRRVKETGKDRVSRVLGSSSYGGPPGIRVAPRSIKRKQTRTLASVAKIFMMPLFPIMILVMLNNCFWSFAHWRS